jgi:hypothetical protein
MKISVTDRDDKTVGDDVLARAADAGGSGSSQVGQVFGTGLGVVSLAFRGTMPTSETAQPCGFVICWHLVT